MMMMITVMVIVTRITVTMEIDGGLGGDDNGDNDDDNNDSVSDSNCDSDGGAATAIVLVVVSWLSRMSGDHNDNDGVVDAAATSDDRDVIL